MTRLFKTLALMTVTMFSIIVSFNSSAHATLYLSQFSSAISMYSVNESTGVPTQVPLIGGTVTQPVGVAINNNALYMASSTTVKKIDAFGNVSTFATGFTNAHGIAFDSSNNLYVANKGASTISKVTPAGVVSTFATGIANPQGLAFDATGNLFVSSSTAGNIKRITPGGIVSTVLALSGNSEGMAFDASRNLYIANGDIIRVITVSSTGSVSGITKIGSGVTGAKGITIDPAGNIFVVGNNTTALGITKFTPGGVSSSVFVGPFVMTGTPYFITQGTVLPEPATLGLLGIGSMMMLRRRRR